MTGCVYWKYAQTVTMIWSHFHIDCKHEVSDGGMFHFTINSDGMYFKYSSAKHPTLHIFGKEQPHCLDLILHPTLSTSSCHYVTSVRLCLLSPGLAGAYFGGVCMFSSSHSVFMDSLEAVNFVHRCVWVIVNGCMSIHTLLCLICVSLWPFNEPVICPELHPVVSSPFQLWSAPVDDLCDIHSCAGVTWTLSA